MKCSLLLGIFLLFNTLAAFAQVPTHLWSNNVGSSNNSNIFNNIAVDSEGNIYCVGYFTGTIDFDPSVNTANLILPTSSLCLAKYDKDGNYLWAYYFESGFGGAMFLFDLKIDNEDNLYISGGFSNSMDFDIYPTTTNIITTTNPSGIPDSYVAKYNSDGRLVWVQTIKSVSSDGASTVSFFDVDVNGNIVIAGTFAETIELGNAGFQLTAPPLTNNMFFAKYDANGNFLWAKHIVNTRANSPLGLTISSLGNIYIFIDFQTATDFDVSNSDYIITPPFLNTRNFAICKYSENGVFIWAKPIFATSNLVSAIFLFDNTLSTDNLENLTITGSLSQNYDFDPSLAVSLHSSTNFNSFFAKYDVNGNLLDRKQIVGSLNRVGRATTDDAGNLYFPFFYQGTVDIDLSATGTVNLTAVSPPFPNYSDLSMVSFDKDFNYLWHGEVFPQNDNNSYVSGSDLELDTKGNFYMAGQVRGTADFDMLAGVANVSSLGTTQPNAFLAKYGIPECGLNLKSDTVVCGSSVSLTAPSGFTSYTWTFPDGTTTSTNPTIAANQTGVYYLDIVSRCGTARDSINVGFTPASTLDLGTDKQICAGASTVLNAPSGFTSYTWTLPNSTTSNSQNLTATEAGTYSLQVTNSCGTATDDIDVVISPLPTVDLGIDQQICAGTSTILNAPSGFTSYTWTLPNSTTSNSQNLTATEAGTYSLQVTNSCGTATDDIDVVISPLPTVDLGIDKQICAGASTVLNAPSGFTSYTWTLPNSTTSNSQNLTATEAGTYSLQVTNSCGTATDDIDVVISPLPTVDLGIDQQICAGASTVLNAPSGFTSYTWTLPNSTTSNSQNLTATEAGTYSLQVTNSCGTATDDIDVVISPLPTVDLGIDQQICAGTSTILNAPSGFTSYTWTLPNSTTSNSQNLTATEAGTYSLSVTNSCGTATDDIDVVISPLPTVDLGTDKQICAGNSTVLNAPSGFTSYTWTLPNSTTSNSQNLTATEAGTYSLSVTNSCGTATDDIDVVISPLPTVDLGIDKQICAGTSTILNAPSGFTSYTWILPNNSVSNLQTITVSETGIYKLTVTNSCGAATDEIKIQVAPNPSLDLGNDIFTCQNDTTLSAPIGFDSYNWTFPNGTTSNQNSILANQEGNYILKVENNCGNAFDTISVSFDQKPNIDLGFDTLLCQNESIIISLPISYDYIWFDTDTSKNRSFSSAGIYYFDIINECGAKRDSIIINNFVEPTVDLGEDKLLCEGETVVLSIENPTNFPVLWNTGDTTNSIEINKKGTYSVQLFSNCQIYSDSVQINYKSKPNLTPQKDTVLCQNENYFVEIDSTNQDVSIIWFDGNTDFSHFLQGEGTYFYTLSNECGNVSDTFSIVLPNNDDINIDLGEDKILCNGESTMLNAANESGNFDYLWNTGDTTAEISVNTAGLYVVTLSNECTSKSDTIKIEYVEEINTEIKLTQKDCGEAILNVALKENETIKWNDGSTKTEFVPTKSGVYEAQVSNSCETKNYSIEVEIINFDEEFPNVITPNDDGFNDAYVLPFEGAQIFVYDRWEKLVYKNDNYKNDWSPKNLTGGTYYLLIKHPCLDGNKKIVLSILD
ncbi:gliding motility-associated C-terminal domain-containing protein [Bernardetia sp. OM2101]|uniref:T9SS type B sorting domain-containing protein n=1 Tax=Bernardetia sp. OM2101 TaxID=3344876 RepID=UPI0035D08360